MTRQLTQTEMPSSVLPEKAFSYNTKLSADKKLIEGCWLQLEDLIFL